MDENAVRSLLGQLADTGGPPSSVDVEKARRAGLRRLLLRRLGAPAASLGAIVIVAGLVASGAMPFGLGFSTGGSAQATVRLTDAEVAVLTNSGRNPGALAQINNAVEVLVQRCMKSRGFKYYPVFISAADEGGYPGLAGVPQAPIGLAGREANGYGFSRPMRAKERPYGGQAPSRNEKYAKTAGQKYFLALEGSAKDRVSFTFPGGETGSVSGGGCAGVAKRRIYGSVLNYVLATNGSSDLTAYLLDAVTADPAFSAGGRQMVILPGGTRLRLQHAGEPLEHPRGADRQKSCACNAQPGDQDLGGGLQVRRVGSAHSDGPGSAGPPRQVLQQGPCGLSREAHADRSPGTQSG